MYDSRMKENTYVGGFGYRRDSKIYTKAYGVFWPLFLGEVRIKKNNHYIYENSYFKTWTYTVFFLNFIYFHIFDIWRRPAYGITFYDVFCEGFR